MTLVLVPIVGIVALTIALRVAGTFRTLFALVIIATAVFPRVLAGSVPADAYRSSISGEQIRIFSFTIAVAIVLLVAVLRPQRGTRVWVVVPFLLVLPLWLAFVWDGASSTSAGAFHLTVGLLAWVAGSFLARLFSENYARHSRYVAQLLLMLVIFETLITILQAIGLPVFPQTNAVNVDDISLASRVNGTFSHPSVLGKVSLLLLAFLLPLSVSPERRVKVCAWVAVALMSVPLVLTAGRANFVGYLIAVVLWVMLLPRSRAIGLKVLIPLSAGLIVVASWAVWSDRIQNGEDGSLRDHFNAVAVEQLQARPWWQGVGPGNYVEALASIDPWIAAGWPVHNTYLLAAVEMGVPLTILFFLPFAVSSVRSVRLHRRNTRDGETARAFLCILPGLLFVSLTGWGMLAELLPLWMLVAGWAATSMQAPPVIQDRRRRAAMIRASR